MDSGENKPVRRWQVRLPTLFWFTFTACCILGWWVDRNSIESKRLDLLRESQLQQATIDTLQQEVRTQAEELDRYQNRRSLARDAILADMPPVFVSFTPDINVAKSLGAEVVDGETVLIGQLWSGEAIDILHLRDMLRLRNLHFVRAPPVTESSFEYLSYFRNLSGLQIDLPQMQADWLRHLTELKNLRTLQLTGDRITDDAIQHLAELKSLAWLRLDGTKISEKGLDELQEARPGLQILINGMRRPTPRGR